MKSKVIDIFTREVIDETDYIPTPRKSPNLIVIDSTILARNLYAGKQKKNGLRDAYVVDGEKNIVAKFTNGIEPEVNVYGDQPYKLVNLLQAWECARNNAFVNFLAKEMPFEMNKIIKMIMQEEAYLYE